MAEAVPSAIRTSTFPDHLAARSDVPASRVENQLRPEDAAFSSLVFLFAVILASLAVLSTTVPARSITPSDVTSSPPCSSSRDNTNERQAFYSIPELAIRWRCSRGTVYNRLRFAGAKVLDFASAGKKGKKLVPALTVFQIESRFMKGLP
jgi:hypothetical protein